MIVLILSLLLQMGGAEGQEPSATAPERSGGDDLGGMMDSLFAGGDSLVVVVDPVLEGAVSAMEAGDNEAAAAELEDIVLERPDHLQAHRLLASCYIRLENFDGAISSCLQIAALDSTDTSAHIALGALYQRTGDPDSAELYYTLALDRDPGAHMALFGKGWIDLDRRNLEAAHDAATRITEMAPDFAPNYILLGRILTIKGFYEDAARAYRRAFDLDSGLRTRYGILLQELTIRHRLGRS